MCKRSKEWRLGGGGGGENVIWVILSEGSRRDLKERWQHPGSAHKKAPEDDKQLWETNIFTGLGVSSVKSC